VGVLLPVASMLVLSVGTLLTRRAGTTESPPESLTIQSVTTAALFSAVAAVGGRLVPPADPGFWWSVAWVVGLSTFGGYGVHLFVVRRSGPTRASTLLYLTPPTTMIWAYLIVDRRIVGAGSHDGRRERARRFLARHP